MIFFQTSIKTIIKNKKVQFASAKNINYIYELDVDDKNADDSPPKLQIRINSGNFSLNFKPQKPTLLTAASLGDLDQIHVRF